MKAMFDALNIVYDEDEKRGFIKLNLISLTFTFGAIVFLLLALGAVVVDPGGAEAVPVRQGHRDAALHRALAAPAASASCSGSPASIATARAATRRNGAG